ncbi:MAG TPA: hypothetical protein VL180_01765 [Burkholderiales bacterium]|jgi:hypothetical protein|nr:hypothetical protein [Burkholderiales bacterium]
MRLKSALEILPRLYGANSYLRTAGYLFVVGHMRSYSSLLAHILGSHPRIVGYAEMHQKYRNVLDLLELTRKVERTCDKSCAGRYVLDKILHRQVLEERVMRRKDVRVIAIAREPEASVASILAIRSGGIDSIEGAIAYYLERMEALKQLSEMRDGDLAYVDGESILEESGASLRGLSSYLAIEPALRSEYSTFRLTGVPKYGDPSEWIKAGRVVRRRAPLPRLQLTAAQARQLSWAYESMRSFMSRNTRVAMMRSAGAGASASAARGREILRFDRRTGSAAQPAEQG